MAASADPKPTLYDFLFIDFPRVQSLYSQLYSGLLSEIINLVADIKAKETEIKAGGAPVGSLSSHRREQHDQSRSESFDPHDVILRDVLGGLMESGMITTDEGSDIPASAPGGMAWLFHPPIALIISRNRRRFSSICSSVRRAGGTSFILGSWTVSSAVGYLRARAFCST